MLTEDIVVGPVSRAGGEGGNVVGRVVNAGAGVERQRGRLFEEGGMGA